MFLLSLWQTYASYGVTGEKARYCAKHKGLNMVNLTVKHCEFSGCVTQPSFNYAGQRKARSVLPRVALSGIRKVSITSARVLICFEVSKY